MRYSNNKHEIIATEVRIRALIPKTYIDTKNAGINAITTSYIIFLDVLSECTCGDADIIIGDVLIANFLPFLTF